MSIIWTAAGGESGFSVSHILPEITEEKFLTYGQVCHQGVINMLCPHFKGLLMSPHKHYRGCTNTQIMLK